MPRKDNIYIISTPVSPFKPPTFVFPELPEYYADVEDSHTPEIPALRPATPPPPGPSPVLAPPETPRRARKSVTFSHTDFDEPMAPPNPAGSPPKSILRKPSLKIRLPPRPSAATSSTPRRRSARLSSSSLQKVQQEQEASPSKWSKSKD